MKKKILFLLSLGASIVMHAQTLYIPKGSNGIGTSTNGNTGVGTNTPYQVLTVDSRQNGSNAWFYAGSGIQQYNTKQKLANQ